jgi:hypothetical protein
MLDYLPAILGFAGVAIGSFLTFLGVRYTARQSATAARTAATVSNRQVDVDEWRSLVTSLREEVDRLTGRVEALEHKREDDRDLIERLKADVELRDHKHRSLLAYVREVLAWARRVAPEHSPPPVPDDLVADLDSA